MQVAEVQDLSTMTNRLGEPSEFRAVRPWSEGDEHPRVGGRDELLDPVEDGGGSEMGVVDEHGARGWRLLRERFGLPDRYACGAIAVSDRRKKSGLTTAAGRRDGRADPVVMIGSDPAK